VLTTLSRNSSYADAAAGKYDHIRVFQTGWRLQRKASTWILVVKAYNKSVPMCIFPMYIFAM
jgi:hypothetical protein